MKEAGKALLEKKEPRYQAVLFDLDGTLTCSHPGILQSVKLSLEEMGIPIPSGEVLRKFIGPPLAYSYTHFCGMSMEEAEEGIRRYRAHYNRDGIFNCTVYQGIIPLLEALQEAGVKLGVATAKPGSMAMRVLEHFGLLKFMDTVSPNQEDEKGTGKAHLILKALKDLGVSPENAVMIGDTRFDCQGALEAGTAFIGAAYGYGGIPELKEAGAQLLAASPQELGDLLWK